jgi:hypothetical protein
MTALLLGSRDEMSETAERTPVPMPTWDRARLEQRLEDLRQGLKAMEEKFRVEHAAQQGAIWNMEQMLNEMDAVDGTNGTDTPPPRTRVQNRHAARAAKKAAQSVGGQAEP